MDWIDIKKQLPPTDTKIWGLDKNGNAIAGVFYINRHGIYCLKAPIRHQHIYKLEKWATYDVIY